MLSRIIRSNPTIPPVPSPTRHETPSRKKFMLRVFISGNYGKAIGATAIDYIHGSTSTDPDFEIAEEKIRMDIDEATKRITKLKTRRDSLPARVTVADAQKGHEMVSPAQFATSVARPRITLWGTQQNKHDVPGHPA